MSDRPNVLFLLSDEHSFRCQGRLDPARGGEPVRTPAFDALAERGTVFEDTCCQMPLCTPSRLCLLTGRQARAAGAWDNGSMLRDLPTLPGAFADAGYATCLVGKMHLGGDRQFAGFQHRPYGDLTGNTGHQPDPITPPEARAGSNGMRARTADAGVTTIPEALLQEQIVVRTSLAWLREHRARSPGQPWFLCASFSRPHFPLTAPRRWFEHYWPTRVTEPRHPRSPDEAQHPLIQGMDRGFRTAEISRDEMLKARAAYFACVSYLDEIVGEMLALLGHAGLLQNTIVVYTSDHGELAGEHGVWWKHSWHEAATRVPWIVQTPEHRAGTLPPRSLRTPASLADLFPTLCGLCGVPTPPAAQLDGADLSGAIRGAAEPAPRPVFCDNLSPRWGAGTQFRMVRQGRWKYVGFAAAPPLLFDLEADPGEQHNLADAAHGTPGPAAAEALARLRALVAQSMDFPAAEAERVLDLERLKPRRLAAQRAGNLFHLPDGRWVDADAVLYHPRVIAAEPERIVADWPDGGGDAAR